MAQFSRYFTREQLEATRHGENIIPDDQLPHWILFTQCWLDTLEAWIRLKYGWDKQQLKISSGYRSPRVNGLVGGHWNSKHLGMYQWSPSMEIKACAADLQWAHTEHKSIATTDLLASMISHLLSYDKMVVEKVDGKEWVHISVFPHDIHLQRNLNLERNR